MVESFDDGIGYMLLANNPHVDIIGITTVTGNTWSPEGLTYAIRLGELAHLTGTQYVQGAIEPLRPRRLDDLNGGIDTNPGADAYWRGAVGYPQINDWEAFYRSHYGQAPSFRPSATDAAEFIAQQVLQNPDEMTLLAIGPCTNIAKALILHPEIAEKVKEIIYMGGALYCDGNTTPYAEWNFLYDPEAAAVCLRSPFSQQTVVSLDVCNNRIDVEFVIA